MAQIRNLNQELDSQTLHVHGVTMAARPFRQCVFILDELLSCFDCYQFLIPVPHTAVVYHKEIKTPMDFRTLEQNLYNDKYKDYKDFIADLCLIWNNAKTFHRSFDPLYQQAENLCKRYESIEAFMDGGPQPFYLSTSITDKSIMLGTILPEEKLLGDIPRFPMYKEIEPTRKSNLYFIQALSEQDCSARKLRGFSNVRLLFQNLNTAFFNYVTADPSKQSALPLPRFYIAKNRTLLNQARADIDGALAILYNVQLTPMEGESSGDLYRLRTTVVLSEPMGETHNFDESTMDKSHKYEFCPKAWLKLKVLKVVHNVEAVINADIDRSYLKKVYNTFKLSTKYLVDPKKVRNQEIAKQFVRSILEPVPSSTPIPHTPRPTTPEKAHPGSQTAPQNTPTPSTSRVSPKLKTTCTSIKPKPNTVSLPYLIPKQSNPACLPARIRAKTMSHQATLKTSISPLTSPLLKQETTPPASSHCHKNSIKLESSSLSPQTTRIKTHVSSAPSSPTSSPVTIRLTTPTLPTNETPMTPTTIRLILNANKQSPPMENQGQQAVTSKQVKKSDSDYDYDSSSTASYEYSEEEEDLETYNKLDVNTTTDTSNITSVNSNNNALLYNNNHLNRSPFTSLQNNVTSATNSGNPTASFERYLNDSKAVNQGTKKQYYIDASKELWRKLSEYSNEKDVPLVDINQYNVNTSSAPNAEGFFKHVFFMPNEPDKVVQTFRRMTITQRTTEIVGLLALKGLPHMGQITEVLKESHGEIIGLCMQRYEKTLKQYTHAHSHHRLTAYQKMDLIIQMLQCIEIVHKIGLAHRDLSEVNFMVNATQERLRDGSPKAELFLIDFGKSTFTDRENYRRWWVEQPCRTQQEEYEGEIIPKDAQELDEWCQHLPWVRSKPDHGYRLYRSIQTLPRSRVDTEDLQWMVNPLAEDLYSIGTIIWKTFSETEPWYGILDTDLKGLRETVGQDYHIERALQREVPGKLSRELLLKFLKTTPQQRQSATQVLAWLQDINVQNGLIAEWEQHAPVGRQKRHAKALFRYDDEQAAEMEQGPHRKKLKANVKQNCIV